MSSTYENLFPFWLVDVGASSKSVLEDLSKHINKSVTWTLTPDPNSLFEVSTNGPFVVTKFKYDLSLAEQRILDEVITRFFYIEDRIIQLKNERIKYALTLNFKNVIETNRKIKELKTQEVLDS